MNEHPKVSIVVPAYNAAGYVEGCINSVLAQSCGSFELIIVNDGSKDDTAAVVSAMAEKDTRVKLLTVENGGPAAAREHGLAAADPEAEYVMFLDSDDLLLPDALEYALGGANGADMVIFGYTIVGVDGSERYYCEPEQLIDRAGMAEALPRLYKANLLNQVWGKLYRASLIRNNGIRFRDFRWGEDRLFIFDCLERAGSVAVLPECKYSYIMHPGQSRISSYYDKKFEVCLAADTRAQQLCRRFGAEDDDPHKKGLEMIFNQYKEALTRLGVTPIDCVGKEFDPERHNAVMHIEDESCGENTVVEVLQQGFMLGDKVLRFAIVKVAN